MPGDTITRDWEAKLRNAIRQAGFKPDSGTRAVVDLFHEFNTMDFDPANERYVLMDFECRVQALAPQPSRESFKAPELDEIEAQCHSLDPAIREEGFRRSNALIGPRFTAALERGRKDD